MAHTIETKFGGAPGASSRPLGIIAKARCVVVKALNIIVIWQERAEQRQSLYELDDRMLKDIGVSKSDADHEARKPFWLP